MVYVVLVVLYVLIHYMFVSQTSQVLALLRVPTEFLGLAHVSELSPPASKAHAACSAHQERPCKLG
jgi:hypothetical protein